MRMPSLVALLVSAAGVPAILWAAPQAFPADIHRIEADVLTAFNGARTQPAAYVQTLAAYRAMFQNRLVRYPGQHAILQTQEGPAPVDETIAVMRDQPPVQALLPSELLRQAAADHIAEQNRTGEVGHYAADGTGPAERVMRHGGGDQVAEVIAYGARDAKDVILQLLVDDGVPDRGHRVVMLSPHLRYAGVACGPHPQYGTMCVIDMADTPDGQLVDEPAKVHVAAVDTREER